MYFGVSNDEPTCFYCEMLRFDSNAEFGEIQTALLHSQGTIKQREKRVLDSFRCNSSGLKPAKR